METKTPLRLGKALPALLFVFHGPRHSRPDTDKLPLADVISVNLDHYRLNADFKHGVHFTALPTAWVSESVSQILRWAYWWNSTEATPEDVTAEQVTFELNTDFSTKGLSPQEIQSIVGAWQAGAISRDTMTDLFRRGEVLPEGRTNEEEAKMVGAQDSPAVAPSAAKTPP